MAFLTGTITVQVYSDTQQTEFPKELIPQISKDFQDLTITGAQVSQIPLAASGTVTVNFNSIGTIKRWYLLSDTTDLSVNMNGLGNVTYEAGIPGFTPIQLSSLVLTNSSSSLATTAFLVLITG